MDILGIETSCDETAASVVQNGNVILSNVVASSLSFHKKYGGIIPEIASRKQLELINLVVERAISPIGKKNISAVAVTAYPGLIGSLLVGISWARAFAFAIKKPLITIDHVYAHLYANFLKNEKQKTPYPKLPAIGLVVSGGHSNLFLIKNFDNFQLIGKTRDDAAGEAYDKVARILNLGYPGGPIIDKIAQKGENNKIHFPIASLKETFDFSFSGVKTAVFYHTKRLKKKNTSIVSQIAYSFQKSVVRSLVEKSILCCKKMKIKTLLIGGGVAANSYLRSEMLKAAGHEKIRVFFPPLNLCLDNAAMIAGLGYQIYKIKNKNGGGHFA